MDCGVGRAQAMVTNVLSAARKSNISIKINILDDITRSAAALVVARQQANADVLADPIRSETTLDSQPADFTFFLRLDDKFEGWRRSLHRLTVAHGKCLRMKPSRHRQRNSLKSIDQSLMESVVQTYVNYKASGHGEMAARNAAIVALLEALPRLNFRTSSDMVSQIIADWAPAGQAA